MFFFASTGQHARHQIITLLKAKVAPAAMRKINRRLIPGLALARMSIVFRVNTFAEVTIVVSEYVDGIFAAVGRRRRSHNLLATPKHCGVAQS